MEVSFATRFWSDPIKMHNLPFWQFQPFQIVDEDYALIIAKSRGRLKKSSICWYLLNTANPLLGLTFSLRTVKVYLRFVHFGGSDDEIPVSSDTIAASRCWNTSHYLVLGQLEQLLHHYCILEIFTALAVSRNFNLLHQISDLIKDFWKHGVLKVHCQLCSIGQTTNILKLLINHSHRIHYKIHQISI